MAWQHGGNTARPCRGACKTACPANCPGVKGLTPSTLQASLTVVGVPLFASGKLNPVVTDVFPLEKYQDAYNCMIERRARGKVILTL